MGRLGEIIGQVSEANPPTAQMRGRGPAVDDITLTTGRLGLETTFEKESVGTLVDAKRAVRSV